MVKRRAKDAGFDPDQVCCHTFRGTGTTKLHDRRSQNVQREEIGRIQI